MKRQKKRKSPKAVQVAKDVDGWMKSNSVDKTADYIARGRKFESLSDEQLQIKWIAAFRRMAASYTDMNARSLQGDLSAEYSLRGHPEPYRLVLAESAEYVKAAIAAIEQIKAADPAGYNEMATEIEIDVEKFKSERDRSKS